MLQLTDDGSGKIIKIGNDLKSGIFPQIIVPKDTWQGAKLINGGKFALFGTTVAPGFEYSDFMKPDKSQLMKSHPQFSDFIEILCK
jgi:predicted cupin superfamily sugar epimerase